MGCGRAGQCLLYCIPKAGDIQVIFKKIGCLCARFVGAAFIFASMKKLKGYYMGYLLKEKSRRRLILLPFLMVWVRGFEPPAS
jgi:hypothetical protein